MLSRGKLSAGHEGLTSILARSCWIDTMWMDNRLKGKWEENNEVTAIAQVKRRS